MEEDIMILESECYYLEELGYLRENNHFIRFNQALKNLIKRYKELEKEIEILREYIIIAPNLDEMTALKYAHIQESAYFRGRAEEQQRANETIHKHFIPKSKIKEKIEEDAFEVFTSEYGNIEVVCTDSLYELLEDK